MGVWIEMEFSGKLRMKRVVTPLVGVWIEILCALLFDIAVVCHSPCGSVD